MRDEYNRKRYCHKSCFVENLFWVRFILVHFGVPCGRYGAHPIEHQQMEGGWGVLSDAPLSHISTQGINPIICQFSPSIYLKVR